jgi:hypothetical protein
MGVVKKLSFQTDLKNEGHKSHQKEGEPGKAAARTSR